MVQTTDGNWVGYFAIRSFAKIADQTGITSGAYGGTGLDFGTFCTTSSIQDMLNITNTDANLFITSI
jgi:hypothetical protein